MKTIRKKNHLANQIVSIKVNHDNLDKRLDEMEARISELEQKE